MSRKKRKLPSPELKPPGLLETLRSFRVWKNVRLFLWVWLPALAASLVLYSGGRMGLGKACLHLLFLSGFAFALYTQLCFGVTRFTANRYYSRIVEPVQYWTLMTPWLAFYAVFVAAPIYVEFAGR